MTLYTFDGDAARSGKSACNGPCAANRPPRKTVANAGAKGDGSIITRDDGSRQWADKGKPLYLWIKDQRPGDRSGNGVNNARRLARLAEVRHPVEVAAAEEQRLVAWLLTRLNTTGQALSLVFSGDCLLGGRLLPPAGEAPVALFMQETAQGKRLSLLVRRESTVEATAFLFSQSGATQVFNWIDGPLSCALAGEVPRDELQRLASGVYQQLNR